MNGAPWLLVAQAERDNGVREVPGDGDNPRIIEYLKTVSWRWGAKLAARLLRDETAWCSAFVNWCIVQCGIPGTGSAAARSWERYGVSCELKPGAIVVLKRGKLPWQRHVTFCLRVEHGGRRFVGLGGNQRNRVCEQMYDVGRVTAVRWPHAA